MLRAIAIHTVLALTCRHDGRGLPGHFNIFAFALALISWLIIVFAFVYRDPVGLETFYWFHVILVVPTVVMLLPLPAAFVSTLAAAGTSSLLAAAELIGLNVAHPLVFLGLFIWIVTASTFGVRRYLNRNQHEHSERHDS